LAAGKNEAILWARDSNLARDISATHINSRYLPDLDLSAQLEVTDSLDRAVIEAEIVIVAVPSLGVRKVVNDLIGKIAPDVPIVSLTKGLEPLTNLRMSGVIKTELPSHRSDRIGVLTGPNLAGEVAEGQPTASVVALSDKSAAQLVQETLMTDRFRIYTNGDVVGCEIAGVVKNIVALGVGIAVGLDYGDNARAALMTRGIAEMTRLGVALGGDPLTFSGLAGMGDLIATCSSQRSRNRRVGVELGRGRSMDEILADTNMVAEGVTSTAPVVELARAHRVDMPIVVTVAAVLAGELMAAELVPALMGRQARSE
jgi:glycerol-3-phosphate dehydrogenase (NAD(P)+)